jgi:subtilisin-like proprotein convertase family protein
LARRVFSTFVIALVGIGINQSLLQAAPCDGVPPIDGRNIPTHYSGFPSATQDNPTGFGDATPPSTADTEGSELDRMYIRNDATKLYIGITGNTERDDVLDNTIVVFIDVDAGATPTALNTSGFTGGSLGLKNLSGVTLDFDPDYALAFWNTGTTPHAVLHNLANATDAGTVLTLGTQFAIDDTNLAGVNGEPANDPLQQQTNATTATKGLEFSIDLAPLGLVSTSTIRVQALLINGAGYISNQSLPPLNPTAGNAGGGVACVGIHNPAGDPPVVIDFGTFTGNQFAAVTLSGSGTAPPAIDGVNIPADYTAAALVSTQNNYTCFGDAAPFSPLPAAGSELDRLWVRNDFSKMYIGVTGNIPVFPDFNNTLLIFVDVPGDNGSNVLLTSTLIGGSGALQGMDGVTLDPGFAPEYCIEYWRGNNQHNAIIEDLNFDSDIPLEFTIDTARHTNLAVNAFSADLSNILGINDISGDDPIRQEVKALTAITGMQFSIRLASLGISETAQVKLGALIVSGVGFISNQSLPPLNPTILPPVTGSASFSNAPLPLAIPDNNPTGASDPRTVSIPAIDRITDVNVTVSITHPQVNNLTVTLTHVDSGRSVVLWNPASGSGANLNVTFDSEGGGGTVLPAETLLTLNGIDPNGPWVMKVVDSVTGNTGTLNSWSLQVTEYTGGNIACLGEHDSIDNPLDFGTNTNTPGNQYLTVTLAPTGTPSSTPTNNLFSGGNIPKVYDGTTPATGGGTLAAVPALSVQNNYTCFGDAVQAPPQNLPGSEMDKLFVTNSAGRLKVAITGNLENNGNAYVLLLDTLAGGSGTITAQTAPPSAITGFNNVQFDTPFTPDYAVVVQRNNEPNTQEYSVFLKNIATNSTRSIGRLTRNSGSGVLSDPIPNGNGSELDQLFIQNDVDNLYVGVTGNLESNGNGYIIFLQTGAGGSNPVNTNISPLPTILRNINGDTLDAAITPNWAVVMTRAGGTYSAQLVDLTDVTAPGTMTALTLQNTIGANTFFGDNSNSAGVNSNFTSDPPAPPLPPICPDDPVQQAINAATASRGVQFAISRASIGVTGPGADGTAIKVSVVCVGGSGYWSNQTLPSLGGCQRNLGDGASLQSANAPGDQFLSYTLATSGSYAAPGSFNGTNISSVMGAPKATQNNFTQFGDATAPNPGNANCIQVALDDTNILGVTGNSVNAQTCQTVGGSVVGAASAQTGMEFDIPLTDIGLTPPSLGTQIRLLAVLTGSGGYFSNQLLPGLGTGNSWNLGTIAVNPPCDRWSGNLASATYPGNQWLGYTITTPCSNIPGDINGDGVKTSADVTAFVGVLLGTNTIPCDVSKSEFVIDGLRNGKDIAGFIPAYLAP